MNGKVWLSAYPQGVPAQADVHRYRSLTAMMKAGCERYADHAAFTNLGASLSYAELDRQSRCFAAYLQKGLKLDKGELLAIMLPNILQYPVVFFGALRAGLVVVNVNPLYTPRELKQQLADSGARTIVVLENFAHKLAGLIGLTPLTYVITTGLGDPLPAPRRLLVNFAVKHIKRMVPPWAIDGAVGLREALDEGEHCPFDEPDLGPEDLALLQYTGGTTGMPKAAMLTHGNMVANVMQVVAWTGPALREGVETVVTPLPLYHIFSLTANLLTFLCIGGRGLLVTDPRDIPGLIALLKKERVTAMTGVNTLFNALLEAPGFAGVDFGSLKVVVGGGDSIQESVARRWKRVTGTAIIEGYGLTEASPVVCANRFDVPEYTGMLGLPLPSTEVSIRDDRGNEVPIGQVGEICVKGPQVMKGYWNRPEETAKALRPDGWLYTGDEGHMCADGFIKFHDRTTDIIVVSGFKVFPSEVEDVARMHPGVKEAAATSVGDERSGQAVRLVIVKRDPELTREQVMAHCRENLAGYKVPKVVEFRDKLPKGPIGKVVRRELH
ncbi:MAG: AMP-binding protein [Betaproteobacteria bacterium]|nr:AMP-binding protein [Betaproteobacteria bacterium]